MKLILHKDPFRPHLNSELIQIDEIVTINQLLHDQGYLATDEKGIRRLGTYVIMLNGEAVLQKDWNIVVDTGDLVQVLMMPKGGGGGGSGNIIIAILATVMAFFTFGLSLVAAAAVGVAVYAGLSLLGGMVPTPGMGSLSREATSPTYSLGAQGNNARLLEAVPRVYGSVRVFPDLGSQPYSEYQGNEQYLYQLFCVSLGDVDIDNVYVDETNLSTFSDATVQIVKPGQAVTLFPDNVVTSDAVSNIELVALNNPAFRVSGPFAISPPGALANVIGIDLAMPRGVGQVDNNGNTTSRTVSFRFEARLIDNDGLPIGQWFDLVQRGLTYATSQPQVFTIKVPVPNGRYEVKGYRTSNEGDNRAFDQLNWTSVRAYLPSQHVYPHTTMIAVVMRATNVLNSHTARKFSVDAVGKVQEWDPVGGWSGLRRSSSIAWAAADILRNPVYGRGLPTERFNVNELFRLDNIWKTRGDEFNGTFDTTSQLWDSLSKVMRCGRATPIYYAAVIDFVRDEVKVIPESMFQPSNMVAGSFKTVYNFFDRDAPDHVIVEFLNRDTWQMDTIKCILPGEPSNRPYTVDLSYGITDREHAWREGMSMAAANRDRRRTISFTSSAPGFIPYYNSLARLAHDVPQWGYMGRVLSLNPTTGILRTTEPIPFTGNTPHVIAFRQRNGSEDGPYVIVPDPTASLEDKIYGCKVVGLESALSEIYISDGIREDYTFYQCGPTERAGLLVLVQKATPTADGLVNLTCINYADSVHSAENGGLVPAPYPASNLPGTVNTPIVSSVEVVYTYEVGVQNIVATPAIGALYYEFQARTEDAENWTNLGTNQDPNLTSRLGAGPWRVRVRGIGKSPGPWATWIGNIEASSLPVPTLASFNFEPKLFAIGLYWVYNEESESIASSVEIYVAATNVIGNSIKLTEMPYPVQSFDHTNLGADQTLFYWIRAIDRAGRIGPWFNSGIGLEAHSENNAAKLLDALAGQITDSQLGQLLLDKINTSESEVQITTIKEQLAALWTVRTQLTVGGIRHIAGIAVGVEAAADEVVSQVLIAAQRFAIVDPSSNIIETPFVVQNGSVVMRSLIASSGTFSGALEAASGTFTGELVAATGTFSGILQAGTVDLSTLVGTTQTFSSPGTSTLTVPPGFTSMRVTLQGGGGGGGGGGHPYYPGTYGCGGGGGAGGYAIATFTGLIPGATVTLTVGTAGGGGTAGAYGQAGSATTVAGYITVNGGGGGVPAYSTYSGGGGGGGGAGATYYGGAGGKGSDYGGHGDGRAYPGGGMNGGAAGTQATDTDEFGTYYSVYAGGGGGGNLLGRGGNGGSQIDNYWDRSGRSASGYGCGGGGGGTTAGYTNKGVPYGGNGTTGFAIVEFYNPNGVVIRSEWNTLLSALQRQGIATV